MFGSGVRIRKFRSYLVMNEMHCVLLVILPLRYLFAKKESKARLLRWVSALQEFAFEDWPDCEEPSALYLLSRVSHPQLHFGNPETDIQEKEQKESQKQAIPSTV
ncbi:hypothetical protein Tco_1393210 [Tanacetum coccineum]